MSHRPLSMFFVFFSLFFFFFESSVLAIEWPCTHTRVHTFAGFSGFSGSVVAGEGGGSDALLVTEVYCSQWTSAIQEFTRNVKLGARCIRIRPTDVYDRRTHRVYRGLVCAQVLLNSTLHTCNHVEVASAVDVRTGLVWKAPLCRWYVKVMQDHGSLPFPFHEHNKSDFRHLECARAAILNDAEFRSLTCETLMVL
jgi:hypothetical protein